MRAYILRCAPYEKLSVLDITDLAYPVKTHTHYM